MSEQLIDQQNEQLRRDLTTAVEEADADTIDATLDATLDSVNPAQLGDILDSIPSAQRDLIWPRIDEQDLGAILLETGDEVRKQKLLSMNSLDIARIIESLPDADDQADLILDLPAEKLVTVLYVLDEHKRERLESLLSYPEDTAGGLMDLDPVTIRADVSLDVVLRYLRMRGDMPRHTDQLFVTDRYDVYQGTLSLKDLLTHDTDTLVADVMNHDGVALDANMIDDEVARLFEDQDLISAAVIDDNGKLLGRITIDEARGHGFAALLEYVEVFRGTEFAGGPQSFQQRRLARLLSACHLLPLCMVLGILLHDRVASLHFRELVFHDCLVFGLRTGNRLVGCLDVAAEIIAHIERQVQRDGKNTVIPRPTCTDTQLRLRLGFES